MNKFFKIFLPFLIIFSLIGAGTYESSFTIGRDAVGNVTLNFSNLGCIRWNNTDVRLEYSNDGCTTFSSIGSGGGGGLDTFYTETFEEGTDETDFSCGNSATFLGGGTVDGTVDLEEVNYIKASKSFKFTAGATQANTENDYCASPVINLDSKEGDGGKYIGFNIWYKYSGLTDEVTIIVYDDTNNTVISSVNDRLEASPDPDPFKISVFVPDGVTEIRWGFHFKSAPTSANNVLTIDDVELTTSPYTSSTPTETGVFAEKLLTADIGSTSDSSDLQVDNLVIGKDYYISGQWRKNNASSGDVVQVSFWSGAGATGTSYGSLRSSNVGDDSFPIGVKFTAVSTSLYVRVSITNGGVLSGNTSKDETFIQVHNYTGEFLSAVPEEQHAFIENQQNSGTNRGAYTSGSWQDAVLNTITSESDSIVSLASNQFTLQKGTYIIKGSLAATDGFGALRSALYDVTNSTRVKQGNNVYGSLTASSPDSATSDFIYKVTLTEATTYKMQYYVTVGGQGPLALSTGDVEKYESIYIRKLK